MLLKDMLSRQKDNNQVAICYKKQNITYMQLHYQSLTNSRLIAEQWKDCWNIGIFLPNSIDYVVALFSIAYADKIIVPISSLAKKDEFISSVKYCRLRLVITNNEYAQVLREYLQNVSHQIDLFILVTGMVEAIGQKFPYISMGKDDFNTLKLVAIMLHTSGTTSHPKRVMLTHDNLYANVRSIIESLRLTSSDKTLIALPMYLASGNTSQLLTHIYLGASIVIYDGVFLPSRFYQTVKQKNITNFTCVPTMIKYLLDDKKNNRTDLSSLRFICFGGAKTPVDVIHNILQKYPSMAFVQMYGQTEASTRITHLLPDDFKRKMESVGKPIPGVQVKVVNDEGEDLESEIVGEIIVRGDNVMLGYYNRPDETLRTLQKGWLHTGDLGFTDQDGYLYIVGRKKNVIISGGINIYPEEIEELLICHEAVEMAYVYGVSHDLLGEVPISKIVVRQGWCISEDELLNYCMEHLANYKIPSRILFVEFLPKTESNKIKRF